MTALETIEQGLRGLGYSPTMLIRNYSFADVLSAEGSERRVDLAAFTQAPESYRSAAFGVISGGVDEGAVSRHRALGAPILFSVGTDDVGVWRVSADAAPRLLERIPLAALPELFARNSELWRPQAVHRAKSLGQTQIAYQLDFVDLGLVPAIEHEVEEKLDRLLEEVIGHLLLDGEADREDAVFRTTFRLLAAKILLDRKHPAASLWANATVDDVLRGIESYYSLDRMQDQVGRNLPTSTLAEAWTLLQSAISFRNISSDSLAFVYENTLVTTDTRKRFGTHSTPRQLAEFVVERLNLTRFDPSQLTIFEPFTGAGTFLVAALRHMGDLLPQAMSGEDRHAFLVQRIRGAELDSFACEVATLSLVLADYPNANGWKITTDDLFRPGVLSQKLTDVRVVLCNPPWEDFNAEERLQYPDMAARSVSKPIAVLETILDATPEAIGFVLPQGFLRQKQFAERRQRVAEIYGRVEMTSLPDRIFQRAGFAAAVLIASEPRATDVAGPTKLVSTVVEDRDRAEFLSRGKVTAERRRSKLVTSGDLWIGQLDELWEHLEHHPKLREIASVHRGLQWFNQDAGFSRTAREGFRRGVLRPADSLQQYGITATGFVDVSPGAAYRKGPLERPWELPKVLANVARISRGPWRLAGALDKSGLVPSQAFFGIWPKDSSVPGEAIEAIINGPLASAFASEQASIQHLTNDLLRRLPVPRLERLREPVDAVNRYRAARSASQERVLQHPENERILNRLLVEVDAAVLKAYDLPPKLERRLLEYFRGHEGQRRTSHAFDGWIPEEFTAFIPLHEYLGPLVQSNRGPWTLDVFKPAPENEVAALRRFIH
jgi:type I restriction-modification system DNA methylase subunit